MKINGLDDQSLLLIFDRLSVENLLRAGRVCSRWNTIRGKAALSRKSLTLLIGPNAVRGLKKSCINKIPHYKILTNKENQAQIPSHDVNEVMNNTQSKLTISEFSCFHVNLLSQLFANVHHFTISCPDMNEKATLNIPLVNDLLVKWSVKLIKLKLYIYSQRIVVKNCILDPEWLEYLPFLSTINSMESLKVLHLDLVSPRFESSSEFENEKEDVILMFAFVKRLTQFHFYLNQDLNLSKYLIDCLNVHGDGLCDIATPAWFDNQCQRVKPELAHRFSQFSNKIENAITLRYLCHYFMNLTILNLELEDSEDVDSSFNPNTFYRSMSSLKQLIYLSIYCADSFLLKLSVDPTNIQTHNGQDHINTSVQVLQLGVNDDNDELENHAMFERLCLYHFFPQTRVFIFDNHSSWKCSDCQYNKLSYKQYCLKRMLAATGMQHHCEVIKTTDTNRKWSKEDLICDDEADLVYVDWDYEDD